MSDDRAALPEPEYVTRLLPEHLPPGVLSLAVWGPGSGESCVLRLPDGSVGVVDGCREPGPRGTGDPVSAFVRELGVDRLALIALTHPHRDHHAGLGRLVEVWRGRVERLAHVHGGRIDHGFLRLWTERGEEEPEALKRWLDAVAATGDDARMINLTAGAPVLKDHDEAFVIACGPSLNDCNAVGAELWRPPTRPLPKEAAKEADPNLASASLLARWKDAGMLLGGDMLDHGNDNRGWAAAAEHLVYPVQVVKVAHHASAAAQRWELLDRLRPSLFLVTPFQRAQNGQPPKPEDISALLHRAPVIVTARPEWPESPSNPRPTRPVISPPRPVASVAPSIPGATITSALGSSHDTDNAVAIQLAADGSLRRIVLAGAASFYELPR